MGGFETYGQRRDTERSHESRNRQRKKESPYARPKKSQGNDISPSVVIPPSSDDSTKEKIGQPAPGKHNPDSHVAEMIAA